MTLQLPFGIQPVNPVPVEYYSGPYSGNSLQEAINAANSGIPEAVRFPTMEANLIVSGSGAKYWYNSGVGDEFLSPLVPQSNTNPGSGNTLNVTTFTGSTTLTINENVVICDCSLGPMNIGLPSAFLFNGRQFSIKKKDTSANSVTVNTQNAEQIDGSLTYTLFSRNETINVVSDGSEWFII